MTINTTISEYLVDRIEWPSGYGFSFLMICDGIRIGEYEADNSGFIMNSIERFYADSAEHFEEVAISAYLTHKMNYHG